MVDVRAKRGAELSTDHHLVVCILKGLTIQEQGNDSQHEEHKMRVTSRQKGGHIFASKFSSLFREVLDYTEDVETEWDLFKSAVITSVAASCGCKCVGGQAGSEKKCLVEPRS